MRSPSSGGAFLPTADYDIRGSWQFDQVPTAGPASDRIATVRDLGGVLTPQQFGAKGDGSADDTVALHALRAAAALTSGVTIVLPRGIYAYTTSPNWCLPGVQMIGEGGAILRHTGTGAALRIEAGPAGMNGLLFRDLTIQGNAQTTPGVSVATIYRSTFERLRVQGCALTAPAFQIAAAVLNEFSGLAVIPSDFKPAIGLLLADADCAANTIINPEMEGVTGAGIALGAGAGQNVFIGGTSESNGIGVDLGFNASRNIFLGIDCEANAQQDIRCAGSMNQFLGVVAVSPISLTLDAGAHSNHVGGGLYQSIAVQAGALGNGFVGVIYSFTAGGTFTDAGTGTVKLGVWNGWLGAPERPLLATGAAHTVDDVIAALQTLGLVRQS